MYCNVLCDRRGSPWVTVSNPYAKNTEDSDLFRAFQLWEDLKRSTLNVTAERVKGDLCVCAHMHVCECVLVCAHCTRNSQ